MHSRVIGVRELKDQATRIVRSLRDGHQYVITVNGKPVGVLRPFSEEDSRSSRLEDIRAGLERMDEVAARISAKLKPGPSVVDIISDMRSERDRRLAGMD